MRKHQQTRDLENSKGIYDSNAVPQVFVSLPTARPELSKHTNADGSGFLLLAKLICAY